MSLEKQFRRKLRRHLPAVYARYEESRLRRGLRRAPPVLVFQMGKVGSTSILNSVAPQWPGLTIHVHDVAKHRAVRPAVKVAYEEVIRKRAPVFIISPVREPVGRAISLFFQNFNLHIGDEREPSSFGSDELIEIFLRRFGNDRSLTWFERHFQPIVGVDVYRHGFDPAGFQVIHEGNTRILLMRCELPDRTKNELIRTFLQLESFSLENTNVAAEKGYAAAYEKFKEAFVPPDWFLSQMYDSRYFRHFYAGERDKWIARWARSPADP
jgi:hypothetical protein